MRTYPTDESDLTDAARLLPEPWMLEQLKLNPSYVAWGPHEDYMWKEGKGWDRAWINKSWKEYGPVGLDELNEIVNFYFSVERPARDCETCGGNGTHPDSQWISESFYEHSSPFRDEATDASYEQSRKVMERFGCRFNRAVIQRGTLPPIALMEKYGLPFVECCTRIMEHGGHWDDDITEDEAVALVEGGRGHDGMATAEEFNRANQRGARSLFGSHDAINRWILIKQRLKRLGMPKHCEPCEGHGHLFTGPARLDLTLWMLHPRKGCSQGIEVQNIQQAELPEVYAYLRGAAERNAERFSKVETRGGINCDPYRWRPIAEIHEDYGPCVLIRLDDPGYMEIGSNLDEDFSEPGWTHFAEVPKLTIAEAKRLAIDAKHCYLCDRPKLDCACVVEDFV